MSGLCGWMLRSHHPRSTVEGTQMCAKGVNIQLCAKPKSKIKDQKLKIEKLKIKNQKSKIKNQKSKSKVPTLVSMNQHFVNLKMASR
jgi:hypothetical protein